MNKKNELLEKNLKILQIFQPKLAERLRKRLEEVKDLSSLVSSRETDQGNWISGTAETDIPTFFQKKENLLPELDFPKRKSAGDLQCVFFVYGIGAPPHLFQILRKLPKSALAVVVVEPSLDLILHTFSLTSVYAALPSGCRISFFAFPEQMMGQEALTVNVRQMGTFLATSATAIRHAGETEANRKALEDLERELWRMVRLSIEFLGNTAEDTLIGVRNFALNAPWILNSPNICDFKSLYGRPCISVASGPSLDKNVHLLKDIQDKFIIISADTAARKLLSLGIRPHFVTCIERPQGMYWKNIRPLIKEFSEECSKIVLVAAFVCTPQILARWPGPMKVVGKSELALDKWLAGDIMGGELFPCGSSVAHMAFSLSKALQASSIALIGQDLAYGEEGKSHAGGTASETDMKIEQSRKKNLLEVPAVNGGTVKTHGIWFSFLKLFESLIEQTETPVYDCTQGGALIGGTEVWDLEDFIAEKNVDLEVFAEPPYELAAEAVKKRDIPQLSSWILQGFDAKAHAVLDASLELLSEMENHVSAVSETLLPAQRRSHAQKAALLLDKLHQGNAPLAFIGQSYTSLSGETLARSRSLETMEQVHLWKKAYSEIIEGHRIILRFFSQWFTYASRAVFWCGESPVHKEELLAPWDDTKILKEAQELVRDFESSLEDKGIGSEGDVDTRLVRLNNLLAKMDEYDFPGGGDLLWRMARFLEEQGRGERASRMMLTAQKAFEGQSLPEEQIIAFFQDCARILSKPDLTHVPPFKEALSMARNLLRYNREDLFEALEKEVKNEWRSYLENVRDSRIIIAWDEIQKFHLLADICLAGDDFGGALRHTWSLVQWAYVEEDPRGKRYLQWLCRHLEIALKAVKEEDRLAGEDIVRELAAFSGLLAFYGPLISPGLLEILQKEGLNLAEETAEKKV
jgi:hypothetical protein